MTATWLMLYSVPTEPSSIREFVWRELKTAGAIALQDSAATIVGCARIAEARSAAIRAESCQARAAGLDALIRGFQQTTLDDQEKLDGTAPLYAALYAYCRAKLVGQRQLDRVLRPRLSYRRLVEAHLTENGGQNETG